MLSKANQGLATLEKYRARLDQVSARLTALEFDGGVVLYDVLSVLQRAELVTRMAVEVERYIIELGAEGRLIEMQLEETVVGVIADAPRWSATTPSMDSEQDARARRRRARRARPPGPARLRPPRRAARLRPQDEHARLPCRPARLSRARRQCRGFRASWPRRSSTGSAASRSILAATDAELEAVEGVGEARAKEIREGLRRLQEVDVVDRYCMSQRRPRERPSLNKEADHSGTSN